MLADASMEIKILLRGVTGKIMKIFKKKVKTTSTGC
jgi:hypothetical protein